MGFVKELTFFRNQVRGLRSQHLKDMAKLKELLACPEKLFNPKSKENGVKPIGFATTWHHTKNGTPRQGVIAQMANGFIDVSVAKENHPGLENPQYALEGLENFSHVWILFHFHQNSADGRDFVKTKASIKNTILNFLYLKKTDKSHDDFILDCSAEIKR